MVHELGCFDRFLVLSCHGLFDVLSNTEVVEAVADSLARAERDPALELIGLARWERRFRPVGLTPPVLAALTAGAPTASYRSAWPCSCSSSWSKANCRGASSSPPALPRAHTFAVLASHCSATLSTPPSSSVSAGRTRRQVSTRP